MYSQEELAQFCLAATSIQPIEIEEVYGGYRPLMIHYTTEIGIIGKTITYLEPADSQGWAARKEELYVQLP